MYEFQFDEEDYDMYEIIYAENPIKILVDDRFDKDFFTTARRPYYQMRGRRISEQQAFDIICKTDEIFFQSIFLDLESSIGFINFDNDWFLALCDRRHGWVHPNGIIGTNSIMGKNPTIDEVAHEWAEYLFNFPYLDLIIGITWWDELSPERYEKIHEIRNINNWHEFDYLEYDDFCDNLESGIWVHDRKIEIINRKRAIEVYKEYQKLYEEEDHRVYFPAYYEDFQPDITTMDYLKRCLLTYGITDAEKFLAEKLFPSNLEKLGK